MLVFETTEETCKTCQNVGPLLGVNVYKIKVRDDNYFWADDANKLPLLCPHCNADQLKLLKPYTDEL